MSRAGLHAIIPLVVRIPSAFHLERLLQTLAFFAERRRVLSFVVCIFCLTRKQVLVDC